MTPGEPRQLTTVLLALTFTTGIVDAVTFLGLGQVFAAMQTGNVIFPGAAPRPLPTPCSVPPSWSRSGCSAWRR